MFELYIEPLRTSFTSEVRVELYRRIDERIASSLKPKLGSH